jgi:hypothetical protein
VIRGIFRRELAKDPTERPDRMWHSGLWKFFLIKQRLPQIVAL